MSARIAEDLGFEIGMFAGSTASLTVLGAPDHIVLTLSEFADQAHRICRAGNIALMCDADHGYGNALNVMRTVQELETAGVCGMSIEDTDLPQPFGTGGTARLLSVEEGVGKMKAALAGRQDPKLVIAGRTSAVRMTGLDDAIARAKAYEAVGVDALFMVGVQTKEEIEAICNETTLPVIIGGSAALQDLDYLSANTSVRICLQGHQPIMAGVQAVYDTLKALREGTKPADLKGVASSDLMGKVTRNAEYKQWMDDFL